MFVFCVFFYYESTIKPLNSISMNDNSQYIKDHDAMKLSWDDVTEIYEADDNTIHTIVVDQSKYSVNEAFSQFTKLGVTDFGGNTILRSHRIALWYFPGGADKLKSSREHFEWQEKKLKSICVSA